MINDTDQLSPLQDQVDEQEQFPINLASRLRRKKGSRDHLNLLVFEPCRHARKGSVLDIFQRNSCAGNAFVGLLRNFLMGLSVKVLVKLVRSVISGKLPSLFGYDGLFGPDSVSFALFTGFFTGIYRGMLCSLRNLLREDSMTGTYCAGYMASFAICLLPKADRVPIACYMFVRALRVIGEGLCRHHRNLTVAKRLSGLLGKEDPGIKPIQAVSEWANFDTALFSATAGVILGSYLCAPSVLPKSYLAFLQRAGFKDPRVIGALEATLRGKSYDMSEVKSFCSEQGHACDALHPPSMCELIHPDMGCGEHYLRYYLSHMMGFSLRFYLPLNVVSTLVFNRKKLKDNPKGTVARVLKSVVRSASFLSLYCANAWAMQCFTRRAGLLSVYNVPFFMAISAGPSILLEDKGRRLELAMYCLSPTLQACYNLGMQKGFIHPRLEEFHVLQLFGFAMGVIMTAHEMDMSHLQPTFEQILKNLLGLN